MANSNTLVENSDLPGVKQAAQFNTKLPMKLIGAAATLTIDGNVTIAGTLSAGAESVTSQVITAASANAFSVGANGVTNPVLNVDTSIASVATGLNVKGAAAGGGVGLATLSSATNDGLTLDAKGNGFIYLSSKNIDQGIILSRAPSIIQSSGNGVGTAFMVGPNGNTNSSFAVDTSAASAVTGIRVTAAATGGTTTVATTDSGSNSNLSIAAKGTGTVAINPAVVATAGGASNDGLTYGSLGVGLFTGTGAPSFSAMNGSIYTDSNATTTTTRIYVNKSGAGTAGTTWTALTTAA